MIWGQDGRTVIEPVFPPTCTVVQAQLSVVGSEPSSETQFDTSRIQSALENCATGQAVELVASGTHNAFLIQPIDIPSGVTLLVDAGVTVFASRNPADYQAGTAGGSQDTCGTVGSHGNGCNPLITVNHSSTSDGAGIMGYGVINGRGGDALLVNGVAQSYSWWDLAHQAQVNGGDQNNFVLLAASHANHFTLYKITLLNSPMFHVTYKDGSGFTAWGVKIATPYTARNTDGIDPDDAVSNITIADSFISDGDDDVAVGASGSSAASAISVLNDHFYSGHGLSIGSYTSGGVSDMLASGVNFAGTVGDSNATGIRIKSAEDRGGLVQNIIYKNICMKNLASLIQFNPFYNSNTGTEIPDFKNIELQNVHALTAGEVQLQGHDVNTPLTLTLDNVALDGLTSSEITPAPEFASITLGPGPVTPSVLANLTGTSMSVTNSITNGAEAPYSCTGAFPLLSGELFLTTASTTNLNTLTLSTPGSFNLNAVVEPTYSEVSYGAYTGASVPASPVDFMEGSTIVGTATLQGNVAMLSLNNVTAGTHTYTAQYAGDANYPSQSFGSVTVTVQGASVPITTATTLTASESTIDAGSSVTFTATVSTADNSIPAGTVAFYDGTTQIGIASLNASGSATDTATSLGVGTHSVTAQYLGNGSDAASISAVLMETVLQPGVSGASTPVTISLAAGQSGNAAFTLTPLNGFTGSVPLSCASPVSYITCTVPSTVQITGSGSVSVTANITVASTVSSAQKAGDLKMEWLWPVGLLLFPLAVRRQRRVLTPLCVVLLLLGGAGLIGCSGGGTSSASGTANLPPAGQQTMTVSTTLNGSSVIVATIVVSVSN
ncbi:MAG: glycosyl hydrolase family 28 protein [Acidobacteriaceae bacterium]